MKATLFRVLYIGVTVWAVIAILIYLFQLLAHRQPFPAVHHTLFLLFALTFPRLLFLNTFLHRGLAHHAFTPTTQLVQHALVALSSLSLLPYSPQTWAERHQHYHTRHPHIQHLPSQAVTPAVLDTPDTAAGAADEPPQHVAARCIAPAEYRPSVLRAVAQMYALWRYEDLWSPLPADSAQDKPATQAGAAAAQHYHVVVAAVFNVLALALLLWSHAHLRAVLAAYYAVSLLAVSQLYCWLASAVLLNHSLAFPLLGYQLHANPHHNNLLAALLTAGGAYLNNHHAQPSRPWHGCLPYELDPPALLIHLLSYCGLVQPAVQPPPRRLEFPATAVLAGRVSHTRLWPFHHRFEYGVSFVRVELDALTPLALDAYPLYSSRGRRWTLRVAVDPRAYLTAERVLAMCGDEGVARDRLTAKAGARVLLVTCPSYLGYGINPISYYLVYSRPVAGAQAADVDPLLGEFVGMVSEVHNTPWGERCHYVHKARREAEGGECEGWLCDVKDKKMHVSPFMSMHYRYTLHYTTPTIKRWDVRWTMEHTPQPEQPAQPVTMALSKRHPVVPSEGAMGAERRHLKASMSLEGVPMSQTVAVWNVVRYPLQSVRVAWGIYWQAAVLFVRKHAVFYSHPDPSTRLWK